MEGQTVSINQACEKLGVHRRTIYNWIGANKAKYLRTAGGCIRLFVHSLWRQPDGSEFAEGTNPLLPKRIAPNS